MVGIVVVFGSCIGLRVDVECIIRVGLYIGFIVDIMVFIEIDDVIFLYEKGFSGINFYIGCICIMVVVYN